MFAFAAGAGVRWHRTKQIVDCTPTSGMRDCLIWADSVGHEDPTPFLDKDIMASIERLLQFDPPPAVRRALRWYRIGIHDSVPEDQFQYFWFALEILAEYQKDPKRWRIDVLTANLLFIVKLARRTQHIGLTQTSYPGFDSGG